MGPLAGNPRLSRLSLVFLVATTILHTSTASSLFLRAPEVCGGNADLEQCGGDFPASFCCGKETTCTSVNSTIQAVICCPKGKDCSTIQTVPCDVSQYNATLHPDNQIHFADTKEVQLPKCGSSCCPLGYSCTNGMCSASKTLPSSTTLPQSSSPTEPASASRTSDCTASPMPQANSSFDGKSFAAGFFPGIVIGALGVILFLWLVKKRQDRRQSRYSGDFGHVARTISDPIYDPMHAARTDFIRRGSYSFASTPSVKKSIGTKVVGGGKTTGAGAGGLTPKIKSMWDRTPKLGMGVWSGLNHNNNAPESPLLQAPPPAIRAGEYTGRDPYHTPGQTPERTRTRRKHSKSGKSRHHQRAAMESPTRSQSSETIDVLMPAPSFLEPPRAPGMRENRMTADSGHTTFTKLMERAGYGEDTRESVRNYGHGLGVAR